MSEEPGVPEPSSLAVDLALRLASTSPCRSKRGVVLYDPANGAIRGRGRNGPPAGLGCPGRPKCGGNCGMRSVHAEVRALREADGYIARHHPPGPYDLVHVELAADGGVVACGGPSCMGCAAQILDVGFVGGVWLYELSNWLGLRVPDGRNHWRRYTAAEFYHVTLERCGLRP